MSDETENVPQSCPGTGSGEAGTAAACQGCPNQSLCASAKPQGPDPDLEKIRANLLEVKHIVLVLSGKGGVGKSTVTASLARGLAAADSNSNIGVLDIDICGPSLPRMLGAEREQVHMSGTGWTPVYVEENLALMSIAFLLSSEEEAVIWRGPKKNGMIKQFLRDVAWDQLDVLLVDTPPGTSDEHLSLVQMLKGHPGLAGAVVVTTPQEVSLQDVRREVEFCRKVSLPIIGVVENMTSFTCPKCKTESVLFPPTTGGAAELCRELDLELLGRVPLDLNIAKKTDQGLPLEEDSKPGQVYQQLVRKMLSLLQQRTAPQKG